MPEAIGNWVDISVGDDKFRYFIHTGRIEKSVRKWEEEEDFQTRQMVKTMAARLLRKEEP
jgi:hypothetical protein